MTTPPISASHHASALRSAEETQSGLLRAQARLYAALRRPQPRREREWAALASAAMVEVLGGIKQHREEVEGPEGLYAELLRDAPWTQPRVRQMRAHLQRLETEAVELQIELARVEGGDFHGLPTIRSDAELMLLHMRDVINSEADIVFERFNEPGYGD